MWSVHKKNHHGTTSPSWCWCILHCHASIPSPQGQGQRKGTQPECLPVNQWVDCSVQGGEIHPESCEVLHCLLPWRFWRSTHWALPRYVTVDIQGPEEAFFEEEPQQPTT